MKIWKSARSKRYSLHHSLSPKTCPISPETMVLDHQGKQGVTLGLAEQSIVGRNAIRTKEQDGNTLRTMLVIKLFIPLQYRQHPPRVSSRSRREIW
ncbi:MAG: hypothetical protein JNK87_42785 [Bryobacterales bacterium]|nr:hypothetical protein [Bryobacterales bacterium]